MILLEMKNAEAGSYMSIIQLYLRLLLLSKEHFIFYGLFQNIRAVLHALIYVYKLKWQKKKHDTFVEPALLI